MSGESDTLTLAVPFPPPDPAPMPRDLMAPDTEPTDEELHAVMLAARDAALERKKHADAWTAARLAEAAAVAEAVNRRRQASEGSGDD